MKVKIHPNKNAIFLLFVIGLIVASSCLISKTNREYFSTSTSTQSTADPKSLKGYYTDSVIQNDILNNLFRLYLFWASEVSNYQILVHLKFKLKQPTIIFNK